MLQFIAFTRSSVTGFDSVRDVSAPRIQSGNTIRKRAFTSWVYLLLHSTQYKAAKLSLQMLHSYIKHPCGNSMLPVEALYKGIYNQLNFHYSVSRRRFVQNDRTSSVDSSQHKNTCWLKVQQIANWKIVAIMENRRWSSTCLNFSLSSAGISRVAWQTDG